jgi:hypothetical protein
MEEVLGKERVARLGPRRFQILKCVCQTPKLIRTDRRSIWRPLFGPLRDWPLGVCDFRSIDLTRDLIASDNILPHRIAETYNVLHNERHQWFYLKDQMPNEILVFKSFDSQPGVAISTSNKWAICL